MSEFYEYLKAYGEKAAEAYSRLAVASAVEKNNALLTAAARLTEQEALLTEANQIDLEAAKKKGMSKAMLDRLTLTHGRICDMAEGLRQLAALDDPIGEIISGWRRPNGLEIIKRRVPLGVIGIIFESRPNVTADAAGLCIKSGNACILRGGSEAIHSNLAISKIFQEALEEVGLPAGCVQLLDNTSRAAANEMMKLNRYIDVLIPRGGAGLIQSVIENATVPVIQTGTGNCHIYVDEKADLNQAAAIIMNAKVQRPSVCNAVETILIHESAAKAFLPVIGVQLQEKGVELRGCEKARAILPEIKAAQESDWATEYNDLILAIKIVSGIEEAIRHIGQYGTKHSEAIITEDYAHARRFQDAVDAACVYVNASTRFTDGFEFGFGAEIGISNQKLHARGPMGLKELTTVKYVISGSGQIR